MFGINLDEILLNITITNYYLIVKMHFHPVHFHKSKEKSQKDILLLLIPSIIFVLILTILFMGLRLNSHKQLLSSKTESEVLGNETANTNLTK